mgnify:CR=1 FL=1
MFCSHGYDKFFDVLSVDITDHPWLYPDKYVGKSIYEMEHQANQDRSSIEYMSPQNELIQSSNNIFAPL